MTAALPEAVRAAGTPIEVWFQDEARVGQQGTLTYVWAEKGSRPRALKDLRYEWAYLFGAVCAERGVGAEPALLDVCGQLNAAGLSWTSAFASELALPAYDKGVVVASSCLALPRPAPLRPLP